MDLSFQLLLLLLALLCTITLYLFHFFKPAAGAPNLPPGKMGFPVVGETLEFFLARRNGTPEKFVKERMETYSSHVFKTSLFGQNVAVLCGDAGNKFLFSNDTKILASWWPHTISKVLSFPSFVDRSLTEESKKLRSILPEFMKPESLRRYVGIMDSMAKQHLQMEWVPKGELKVHPISRKYTFALACKLFMSVEDAADVDRIANHFACVRDGLMSLPVNFPGTAFNRAIKAGKIIHRELLAIVGRRKMELSEKRETVAKDLLSCMLLASEENGKFVNEVEIASLIFGFLIAGHDTASTAITFIMSYLADLPHIYDQVFEEQMEIAKAKGPEEALNWYDVQKMKLTWNVVNEVMRLAPPSQGAFKVATTDFTYAGFTVPKGWKAHWSVHSTNKNPKYFENPEKFDPSRFEGKRIPPYAFVPFGAGPRMCPGREYARLEILVFIHNVVKIFKWEKQIPNEKIVYTASPTPKNGLPIRLCPHEK
ncbi:beta-amyrin 28-monooxygenase-like [Malania oleifera]|uniref:beta-amyrin 28-monooxygenase-like n=1 Tax=Malania oleifera TaxID=397392 RepID=UPI0025AECD17|nr:beta-amyrin 28-monooxygenase-like [Malania oleifera]